MPLVRRVVYAATSTVKIINKHLTDDLILFLFQSTMVTRSWSTLKSYRPSVGLWSNISAPAIEVFIMVSLGCAVKLKLLPVHSVLIYCSRSLDCAYSNCPCLVSYCLILSYLSCYVLSACPAPEASTAQTDTLFGISVLREGQISVGLKTR